MCWPMVQVANNCLELDLNVAELEWLCVLSADEIEVVAFWQQGGPKLWSERREVYQHKTCVCTNMALARPFWWEHRPKNISDIMCLEDSLECSRSAPGSDGLCMLHTCDGHIVLFGGSQPFRVSGQFRSDRTSVRPLLPKNARFATRRCSARSGCGSTVGR